jgi:hypothetical protein
MKRFVLIRYSKISHKILFEFLFLIVLTGCGVYHAQTTDIPLINKKNDLRIDAGISVIPSVHATFSYGLTNKVAIQTFGSIGNEHRYYFQIAPGLYKMTKNQKIIELYSGFGHGYANTQKNLLANDIGEHYTQKLFGNYQLYFVQFNFGRNGIKSKNMVYGFGIKTGLFHSNLTDHNYYNIYSHTGPFIENKDNSFLIEPTFFFRMGHDNIKFSYKFGLTRIITFSNGDRFIPAPVLNMGFGINFSPKIKIADAKL